MQPKFIHSYGVFVYRNHHFPFLPRHFGHYVNFLNSAVGSKTAKFRNLIIIASIGVFLGASLSNGMMDIARHGIFQPQYFSFAEIVTICLAVMVTDVRISRPTAP